MYVIVLLDGEFKGCEDVEYHPAELGVPENGADWAQLS